MGFLSGNSNWLTGSAADPLLADASRSENGKQPARAVSHGVVSTDKMAAADRMYSQTFGFSSPGPLSNPQTFFGSTFCHSPTISGRHDGLPSHPSAAHRASPPHGGPTRLPIVPPFGSPSCLPTILPLGSPYYLPTPPRRPNLPPHCPTPEQPILPSQCPTPRWPILPPNPPWQPNPPHHHPTPWRSNPPPHRPTPRRPNPPSHSPTPQWSNPPPHCYTPWWPNPPPHCPTPQKWMKTRACIADCSFLALFESRDSLRCDGADRYEGQLDGLQQCCSRAAKGTPCSNITAHKTFQQNSKQEFEHQQRNYLVGLLSASSPICVVIEELSYSEVYFDGFLKS
ncbi:uncharacterized protein LOC135202182 [Macrobrachium nipponense]|uniref:uncharacterized protein LOC135202182 n=1 Tax=Macrobrachium nipponense TaxID=159736 RepID=UPI0030C86B2C